jgi:hypothetical protein
MGRQSRQLDFAHFPFLDGLFESPKHGRRPDPGTVRSGSIQDDLGCERMGILREDSENRFTLAGLINHARKIRS